jgi:MFS family permease
MSASDLPVPGIGQTPEDYVAVGDSTSHKSWRFHAILTSLSVTGLLTTIEGTIITNALPTITAALGAGSSSLWIADAYFLASVATLPLYAQMSNIFGRRPMLLGSVAIFVLGGGLSGGSISMGMLIASRTIQGLGGGGVSLLIETVVQDLVPLRERGKYMSIVLMFSTLGAALGALLGGLIVSRTSWRWVFYINVPVGGGMFVPTRSVECLLTTISGAGRHLFLPAYELPSRPDLEAAYRPHRLCRQPDLHRGDGLHAPSPHLGRHGIQLGQLPDPRRSDPRLHRPLHLDRLRVDAQIRARTILPTQNSLQPHLFVALILTFLHSTVTYWTFYFLPIYFQAVKDRSPLTSGVDTLPTFAGIIPFAIMGGVLLSKTGRYKPLHFFAFIPLTIGFGLFSTLDENSSTAAWVCYQLLCSVGAGCLAGITLPAVQAPLDESDVATATGLWSFIRGFGAIWGVTIPAAVFNNESAKYASMISNSDVAQKLAGGKAYEYATQAFLNSIDDPTVRAEVIRVFAKAIQTVWYVCLAFAVPGLVVTLFEREVKSRQDLQTEFGIEDTKDPALGTELSAVEAGTVRSS